jgi:hypothetical protein
MSLEMSNCTLLASDLCPILEFADKKGETPREDSDSVNIKSDGIHGSMSSYRMDVDESLLSVVLDIYEPIRHIKVSATPKRFHRTFWRSVARRLLALSSMQTMCD